MAHIETGAFVKCVNLSNITIPDSVTEIGAAASLTEIDHWVFYDCNSLKSLTISKSMMAIHYRAFQHCNGLESIIIPGNITVIGEFAFGNCSNLTEVTISEGVTDIEQFSFADCTGLTDVTVPNSVSHIGVRAFLGCTGLTGVTIPASVIDIEDEVFLNCPQVKIYGWENFMAHIYAEENNIPFVSLGTVESVKISGCQITVSPQSYQYDGTAKTPVVTVKHGKRTLTAGKDYDIAYYKNINAGTAKATVTGQRIYTGTVTKNFTITVNI